MEKYLDILKALACIMRIRIINILSYAHKGLCVCEMMDALDESQYNISRHLKVLKYAGLVKDEKKGRWIEYSIVEPRNEFHRLALKTVFSIPQSEFEDDIIRLKKRLSLRKNGVCVIGISEK